MSKRSRRRQHHRPLAGVPASVHASTPPPTSTPEPERLLLDYAI